MRGIMRIASIFPTAGTVRAKTTRAVISTIIVPLIGVAITLRLCAASSPDGIEVVHMQCGDSDKLGTDKRVIIKLQSESGRTPCTFAFKTSCIVKISCQPAIRNKRSNRIGLKVIIAESDGETGNRTRRVSYYLRRYLKVYTSKPKLNLSLCLVARPGAGRKARCDLTCSERLEISETPASHSERNTSRPHSRKFPFKAIRRLE